MFFILKQGDMRWHVFGKLKVAQEVKMNSLKDKIKDLEKMEILSALNECNWVMARAARKLGITERMMGYKIKKYGIRKEGEVVHNSHFSA